MSEPFIGQIILVGFNFAPRGYATCDGQLIAIAQNTALFSLLGTMYGGNGQTTFALPDLRGRVPIHAGMGPGLSLYTQGQAGGEQSHTLISTEIPAHTHSVTIAPACSTEDATQGSPKNGYPAVANGSGGTPVNAYGASASPSSNMAGTTAVSAAAGGNQPHNNLQPYLTLNYCIALEGIFPSRN